ncbi:uncharacterized protein LOC144360100 [Saccoglossus kowalevskii]
MAESHSGQSYRCSKTLQLRVDAESDINEFNPCSVAMNGNGNAVVSYKFRKTNRYVAIYDLNKGLVRNLVSPQCNFGSNFAVGCVTWDAGKYLMSDDNQKKVFVINADAVDANSATFLEKLERPRGIAVDRKNELVYVVDGEKKCIQVYNRENYKFKKTIGEQLFKLPKMIAVNSRGHVSVSDYNASNVKVLSPDGVLLNTIDGEGDGDHSLKNPRGVAIDELDNMYVCNCDKDSVLKFSSDGQFMCRIDKIEDGLDRPSYVALTGDTPSKVIVVDRSNSLRIYSLMTP